MAFLFVGKYENLSKIRLLSMIESLELQRDQRSLQQLRNGDVPPHEPISCNGDTNEDFFISELKRLVTELHKELEKHRGQVERLKLDREHYHSVLSKKE